MKHHKYIYESIELGVNPSWKTGTRCESMNSISTNLIVVTVRFSNGFPEFPHIV